MPAHLLELTISCERDGCNRTARYVLVNGVNAELGRYCAQHARAELSTKRALEKRISAQKEKR